MRRHVSEEHRNLFNTIETTICFTDLSYHSCSYRKFTLLANLIVLGTFTSELKGIDNISVLPLDCVVLRSTQNAVVNCSHHNHLPDTTCHWPVLLTTFLHTLSRQRWPPEHRRLPSSGKARSISREWPERDKRELRDKFGEISFAETRKMRALERKEEK